MTVQSFQENLLVWVDIVQDMIRVILLARSKDENFVDVCQLFKAVDHVRSQTHLNLAVFEAKLERWLKCLRNTTFEFRSDQGLVHVKNQRFGFLLFAKLERFQHKLVLVLVLLFVAAERVAVIEQLDQLEIDQLSGVFDFFAHHGTSVFFDLKWVIAIITFFAVNVLLDA
jgi:hypothetical protein